MAQPEVLTIREAQAALNLSGPRVHQLLADGELDGPGLPSGRKRHSPGAPRVTASSIDRYVRERQEEQARASRQAPPDDEVRRPPTSDGSVLGEAAAKAAAQELKVKLDAMRDELAAERARSKDLLDVVDKLVGLVRSSQASADRLDGVTEGYSQALTQLLASDPPVQS